MGAIEADLPLRAVIFDYGMVLTGPPDPAARAQLERITGLPSARFDELYWADRDAFDSGALTGQMFWQRIAKQAGLGPAGTEPAGTEPNDKLIDELVHWDVRMWMTENRAMLAWQLELKRHGLLTAILSNMGDTIHKAMVSEFAWLSYFDVLVWSYQRRITKPDAAIYRYALEKLGTLPEETLFIDDREENVRAAIAMGMKGIVFTNVDQLRRELVALGLDKELPLP
jgi:putative hydrolase of the HAD superfamily